MSKIGEMDELIEIQGIVQTNNEGSLSEAYTVVRTVWAKMISAKGNEAIQSAQLKSKRIMRLMIRYTGDITTKHRILWRGEYYYITEIDRTARRQGYLYFTAEVQDGA